MTGLPPIEDMEYHPDSERLVEILCKKTQNTDPLFFRIMTAFYTCQPASTMWCHIDLKGRDKIPVNMFAIALATSGYGKGHATSIMERQVMKIFRHEFLENTFPSLADTNLKKVAHKRALKDPELTEEEHLEQVKKEFVGLGTLVFSFDSATSPAVKQMRLKILMGGGGSVNFTMDEIGSNLTSNIDVIGTFLELWDLGLVKPKLTKNTNENIRIEDMEGGTPTNMMLYGTPAKLLNGGKPEDEFYSMLETGYARRSMFGYAKDKRELDKRSAKEIYDELDDPAEAQFIHDYSNKLGKLADKVNFGVELTISEEVSLLHIEYRIQCENLAKQLGAHEELRRAELEHRYFKALKLAGAYAFVEGSPEITKNHLFYAIKLVEESGAAFFKILNREKNYVKLAKYIAGFRGETTLPDLYEDLPFFRGSKAAIEEMMTLAIAWGYKNNIIIKRSFTDGIEFLKGETLKETDLKKMIFSYSMKFGEGFKNKRQSWDNLHKIAYTDRYHWCNHHFTDGIRSEDTAVKGFNMVVIDVDKGIDIPTLKLVMKDYKYFYHTTKRHQRQDGDIKYGDRFRLVLPLSHELQMDKEEFTKFMRNIYEWLPFDVDEATFDRSRLWSGCADGEYGYNDGRILDALLFIPKTTKNQKRKERYLELENLNAIERWMINNTGEGNRNHMYLRYALLLVDTGRDIDEIQNAIFSLNNNLPDPLDETEILATVIKTASKKIIERGTTK